MVAIGEEGRTPVEQAAESYSQMAAGEPLRVRGGATRIVAADAHSCNRLAHAFDAWIPVRM